MTKFLTWLKSLFIHPKEETNQMSEPLTDASTVNQPTESTSPVNTQQEASVAAEPVTNPVPQTEAVKTVASILAGNMVRDFDVAFDFVRDGVETLGEKAKADLISLAKKYL